MTHAPTFGEFLRKIRIEQGLCLRDFADVIDCSVAYVSDVERGTRAPFADEDVRKIARKLGVDEESLLSMARRSKSRFVLGNQMSETKREFAALLEEKWDRLEDRTIQKLMLALTS